MIINEFFKSHDFPQGIFIISQKSVKSRNIHLIYFTYIEDLIFLDAEFEGVEPGIHKFWESRNWSHIIQDHELAEFAV